MCGLGENKSFLKNGCDPQEAGWCLLSVVSLPECLVYKNMSCVQNHSLGHSFTVPCITDYTIVSSKLRFWTLMKSPYSDGQTILFTLKHGYIFVWFWFFFWKQSQTFQLYTTNLQHLKFPWRSIRNVLTVGVIYNLLHVQFRTPQIREINEMALQSLTCKGSSLQEKVAAPSRQQQSFSENNTFGLYHTLYLFML